MRSKTRSLEPSSTPRRKHFATIQSDCNITLDRGTIQSLSLFTYDIVFSEEDTNSISLYQYETGREAYLLLVPLAHFDLEHLFRSKFVKLLCIFSHSVTIPIQTSSRKALTKLLGDHCIEGVWKKGTDYYKVSLPGNCTVSDIDLSAFQQAQDEPISNVAAAKIKQAYEFVMRYFNDKIMKELYHCQEEQINDFYQHKVRELKDLYLRLASSERFGMAFQGQEQYSFEKLRRTIEKMILSRHTKTIGDEQCEEAIHDSVECIFEDCYSRHVKALDEAHLSNDQERPGQVYEKLLEQVFVWLKEYELNINEAKYLYLNRRIIDDIQARRQPLESVANVRICACQDNAKYLKLKREKKQFAVKVKLLKMAHDKQVQQLYRIINAKELDNIRLKEIKKLVLVEKQDIRHSDIVSMEPMRSARLSNLKQSLSQKDFVPGSLLESKRKNGKQNKEKTLPSDSHNTSVKDIRVPKKDVNKPLLKASELKVKEKSNGDKQTKKAVSSVSKKAFKPFS